MWRSGVRVVTQLRLLDRPMIRGGHSTATSRTPYAGAASFLEDHACMLWTVVTTYMKFFGSPFLFTRAKPERGHHNRPRSHGTMEMRLRSRFFSSFPGGPKEHNVPPTTSCPPGTVAAVTVRFDQRQHHVLDVESINPVKNSVEILCVRTPIDQRLEHSMFYITCQNNKFV